MGEPRILRAVAPDEIRQLCVLPEIWPHLVAWLDQRGLYPFRIPVEDDDLPTYGIGVKSMRAPAPGPRAQADETEEEQT